MDKNEYVKRREELQKQLMELKDEYVRTNSPLPIGTKVKVTDGNDEIQFDILEGYRCEYDDVVPIIAKLKKDGTKHATAHIYVGWRSKIEVVENLKYLSDKIKKLG